MTNGEFVEGLKEFEPYLDSKSNSISVDSDTVYVELSRDGMRMSETIERLFKLGWVLNLEFDNGSQYKYWKGAL